MAERRKRSLNGKAAVNRWSGTRRVAHSVFLSRSSKYPEFYGTRYERVRTISRSIIPRAWRKDGPEWSLFWR
jgi:hypothetical protein